MIRFARADDSSLLAELKDAGLLAPHILGEIERILDEPESATADQVLLAGAELIDERSWVAWLIRRHGCHRFGRVTWRDEAAPWAALGIPSEGNLPHRRCDGNHALIAVMRPDRLPASADRYSNLVLIPAAATLVEIRDLRKAWRERSDAPFRR